MSRSTQKPKPAEVEKREINSPDFVRKVEEVLGILKKDNFRTDDLVNAQRDVENLLGALRKLREEKPGEFVPQYVEIFYASSFGESNNLRALGAKARELIALAPIQAAVTTYDQREAVKQKREQDAKAATEEQSRLAEQTRRKEMLRQTVLAAEAKQKEEQQAQKAKQLEDAKEKKAGEAKLKSQVAEAKRKMLEGKEYDLSMVIKQANDLYVSKFVGLSKTHKNHFEVVLKTISELTPGQTVTRFQRQVDSLYKTFCHQQELYRKRMFNESRGVVARLFSRKKTKVPDDFKPKIDFQTFLNNDLLNIKKGHHFSRMLGKILKYIASNFEDSDLVLLKKQDILDRVSDITTIVKNKDIYPLKMSDMIVDQQQPKPPTPKQGGGSSDGGGAA